jgi:hypothetical protein
MWQLSLATLSRRFYDSSVDVAQICQLLAPWIYMRCCIQHLYDSVLVATRFNARETQVLVYAVPDQSNALYGQIIDSLKT